MGRENRAMGALPGWRKRDDLPKPVGLAWPQGTAATV